MSTITDIFDASAKKIRTLSFIAGYEKAKLDMAENKFDLNKALEWWENPTREEKEKEENELLDQGLHNDFLPPEA